MTGIDVKKLIFLKNSIPAVIYKHKIRINDSYPWVCSEFAENLKGSIVILEVL